MTEKTASFSVRPGQMPKFSLTAYEFRAGKNCDLASALRAAASFADSKPDFFHACIECTDQGWAVYLVYQEAPT